jgi:tRNA-specific 2-thiouridylase
VAAEAFEETLFPIGHLLKSEVRDIAKAHGLVNSEKKDSTGICFIGERPFREFLQNYLPASPGQIQTLDGAVIGNHSGLMYYTIGQRQGLGIGGLQQSEDAPWYVVDKRLDDNVLLVAQGEHPLLFCRSIKTSQSSWIGMEPEPLKSAGSMLCSVKIRYRQSDQACQIRRNPDGTLVVSFACQQRAVAPGQYAVFYLGDRCLGGAVIESILSRDAGDQETILDSKTRALPL